MFTGIVEDIGTVLRITQGVLSVSTILSEITQGDSVAVNGICLTVTDKRDVSGKSDLTFDVSPETAKRTNVGELRSGVRVNLERALKVGDRFGGHFMTGHIEGLAELVKKEKKGNSWVLGFSVDKELARYIVPKGSIGVDGISLTVADCDKDMFTVAVVPFTMSHTNFSVKRTGDRANIEPDILAKYAEKALSYNKVKSRITKESLKEHGFVN